MLILSIAIFICALVSVMLLFKVKPAWFTALALFFFAFFILGEERLNFAFAYENRDFFQFGFSLFILLGVYFIEEPEKPIEILGTPAKRFPNRPIYASTWLVIFGFGLPLLFYGVWARRPLEPQDWAFMTLSFYMGVVGAILLKRAWRARRLRLELQNSSER